MKKVFWVPLRLALEILWVFEPEADIGEKGCFRSGAICVTIHKTMRFY
jgi:hypothetical protein